MAASNGPSHGRADRTPDDGTPAAAERTSAVLDSLADDATSGTLRAAAFWGAVVLPFLHVPLLLAGLETGTEQQAFYALLGANAVAIYVGHGYGSE